MGRPPNIEVRNLIIRSAYKLFSENGFNNITTRQLAEYCNLDRALLHHYYNKIGDICVAIMISIQDKMKEFIEAETGLTYPQTGWGYYFKLLMLETFKKRNIFDVYFYVQSSPDLLWRMISESFFGVYSPVYTPERFNLHLVADGILHSTVAYLTKSKELGLINTDDREIVYMGMSAYYNYMGLSKESADHAKAKANAFVTDELVERFIEFYEDALNWK